MAHPRLPPLLHYLRTRFGVAEAAETDGQLLLRFTAGRDEAAFEALLRRHGPLVWGVCRRLLARDHDAEDAFQATFLVLVHKAGSIRKQASLGSWLFGVAHRIALKARADTLRRAGPEPADLASPQADVPAEASLREVRAILDEEVSQLPQWLRAPVVLCCLAGRSKAEAARQLGWNEGTLASRLARARRRLRGRLERRGVVLSSGAFGVLLAEKATAAVPLSVTAAALRLAALCAAGEVTFAGVVSSPVAALAQGVLQTMTVTKLKMVITLAVVLSALVAGAGLAAHLVLETRPVEAQRKDEPKTVAKGVDLPPPETDKQARTDFYGDPLPPGALVRLGSVQFRHQSAHVVFSADGKTLVSGGLDGAVCFWDIATGKQVERRQLRTPKGPFGRMDEVLLAPDGKVCVAWDQREEGFRGKDEEAFLYDTATGKELRRIPTGLFSHHRFVFSPDGKVLATAIVLGGHDTIRLWDVATGKESLALQLERVIRDLSFSPDSKVLASLAVDGILRLWDTTSGRELRNVLTEENQDRQSLSLAYSPDGKTGASTDRHGTVTLWEAATLKKQETLKPSVANWTSSCATTYSPDGALLAIAGDKDLVLWEVAARKERHRLPERKPQTKGGCVAFSPDGKILAFAGVSECHHWDVARGKQLHSRPGHDDGVHSVAVSPDGRSIATAGYNDPTICLWEAATGKPLSPSLRHDGSICSCDFSSDGKLMISGGSDGTLRLLETATGKEVRRFVIKDLNDAPERYELFVCHLSSDGKRLAAISRPLSTAAPENFQLTVWDARTGEFLASRPCGGFLSSRFTPDGEGVTVDTVERLVIEDTMTGKERLAMPGDLGYPAAFSPDGKLLAVGVHKTSTEVPGGQGPFDRNLSTENVRVAEVATGREIFHIDGWISFVAFSRDGRVLATVDARALCLWDAITGEPLFRRLWQIGLAPVSALTWIQSLAFLPDGRAVVTGMRDGTALVWDLEPQTWPAPTVTSDLDTLWPDLAGDAAKAYRSVRALTAVPSRAIPFLKDRLRPVAEADPKQVQRLLADLDSDQFEVRKTAADELAKLGERIEPALRKALDQPPSLEARRRLTAVLDGMRTTPTAEVLRTHRAIQALERIGTPEARRILQTLATGAPAARETREAKEALARLAALTP
jgi:RNA polymerase sigma factor (sigma-70 family)